MIDEETRRLMERAIAEIRNLRSVNAALAQRSEAYSVVERIIGLPDTRCYQASEDIARRLEQHLKAGDEEATS
jgi:divalent metal cation (Fe/Co/Zn/Cd) transporter